ncbi:unnamed protein product [Aspergillus oryzae var. brunneus]|uniref:Unnamed protein product n=2 Tax=Aspergillus oryzae TaxID=5062 RepID=A0AAN4YN11_ASPOZ|nr:unnamed protein product [Aspergillus oryzae]GMG55163.1 unnamed protein product [Aspergillus oryzae var. brunneus]
MTAEEALQEYPPVSINPLSPEPKGERDHLHASHTQNPDHSNLRLLLHMQLPNQEDRQNRHGEIAYHRERTIHIRHGDNDRHVETLAVNIRIESDLGPEILQRFTLQQHEEHEDETGDDRQDHDDIERPDMFSFDGDAHQEDTDGDFAADGGETVGDFT